MISDVNLYVITSNPFPQGLAATNRIKMYGEGIVRLGGEMEVWPIWATEKFSEVKNIESVGIKDGISFKYPKSTVRSRSFIKRRFNDCLDFFRVCKRILRLSSNSVVHIYINSWYKELIILLLLRYKHISVSRELCEYPYATTSKNGIGNKLKKIITKKAVFKLYDGFIVISEALNEVAKLHKRKNAKIVKIPILISTNAYNGDSYVNGRPYIFHGGTMYEQKDAIVSTMHAFGIACKKLAYSIDFILAGPPSPHMAELNQIIQNYGIDNNVKFFNVLPKEKIQKLQNGASLCVLNKHNNLQNRCGFSTKLGEMLLSETPVITTTVGEANFWLKDGVSAYITVPGDFHKIADEIIRAFTDEDLRKRIAENGKKVAMRNFDTKKQGFRLLHFFKEIKEKI